MLENEAVQQGRLRTGPLGEEATEGIAWCGHSHIHARTPKALKGNVSFIAEKHQEEERA